MDSQSFKKINLPDAPGVYLFKKGGDILYIGKATSLKDRVKSYFSNDLISTRGPLILDMVFQADKVDFTKTDSVLEALILESKLIKKHQPRYNTKEKDDKSYNYIVITKEDFPRVLIERGKNLKGSEDNFGPFTNGTQLKEALKIVRKIFPFLDEKKDGYSFYKELSLVPEIGNAEAKKEYAKTIKNIKLFFLGKKKSIIKDLEREMKDLAKKHEFEKAGKIRNTIFALNHIQDIALLKNENKKSKLRMEAYDVAHISGTNTVGAMVVLEDGQMNKNEYRKFKIRKSSQNDTAGLEEILERRFNHSEWMFPSVLVVDGSTAQKNAAQKVLRRLNIKAEIVTVTKDERHRPKAIRGKAEIVDNYKKEILLANGEAHRFAIGYHRKLRSKII
ncbi:MAG: UvrB/UvrC motif-containing protein [Candidatus Paceibacterota bacterium]